MMKYENKLQAIFKEIGINSYEDYLNKLDFWASSRCDEGTYESNVSLLRNAVSSYFNDVLPKNYDGQYISINPSIVLNERIQKYMCLFPGRSLIETEALKSFYSINTECDGEYDDYEHSLYDFPPSHFIEQYYRFRNVINNNIAYLYPVGETAFGGSNMIVSTPNLPPLNQIASVSENGKFDEIIQRSDYCYLALPWLYNARIEDYIEICEKYPNEYRHLAIAIEKIATSCKSNADLNRDMIIEMKDALVNIQIQFENRMADLKKRGATAAVGFALTCIPIICPDLLHGVDPSLLQTIIGSSSLITCKNIIDDFVSQERNVHTDPYWVIWKWKQKAE